MAIEKLQHGYNELGRSSSGPSGIDIINKINEIIDYINSQEDNDGVTPEQIEEMRKQDIGINTSSPYEQEPNKVELVPLLPRDIVAITDEIICLSDIGKVDENRIHNILSKYGVPKQKKFTERDIDDFIEKTYGGNMIGKSSIMRFLSSNDLFSQ